MSGVQMIELHTDQPGAFERLLLRWQESPERSPRICRDRFDTGHFVLMIDESPVDGLPDNEGVATTQDWAATLIDLLDARPRFLDLDSVPTTEVCESDRRHVAPPLSVVLPAAPGDAADSAGMAGRQGAAGRPGPVPVQPVG